MNKQLLVDYIPFEVSPQQINESLTKNNGRLIVSGILQERMQKIKTGEYIRETYWSEKLKNIPARR